MLSLTNLLAPHLGAHKKCGATQHTKTVFPPVVGPIHIASMASGPTPRSVGAGLEVTDFLKEDIYKITTGPSFSRRVTLGII